MEASGAGAAGGAGRPGGGPGGGQFGGKVVLVTGAGSGIGEACAVSFAARGGAHAPRAYRGPGRASARACSREGDGAGNGYSRPYTIWISALM
jgi:hypothetical protein